MNPTQILNKLIQKQNLTFKETQNVANAMITDSLPTSLTASILTALRIKGETPDEILGFITILRKYMTTITAPPKTIDTCGTGGDGAGTFNISTATAFVVAGAGVPVAKHGNRAASSKCGSADVLEALGAKIDYTPQTAEKILHKIGIVFLFAPLYHPALKHVGPIRKELGIRTIFNILGPFLNPAKVEKQIIGVPSLSIAQTLQQVAIKLPYKKLYLVTSEDNMDEISISAKTHIIKIKNKTVKQELFNPEDYNVRFADKKTIQGASPKENAEIINRIFKGEKSPRRNAVVLNSALALKVADQVKTIKEGIELAEQIIDSEKAMEKLDAFIRLSNSYEKHS